MVVQEYLVGKGGYSYLCKKYGIGCSSQIRYWINVYREFGEDGLIRKRYTQTYGCSM
ncbi:MAG: helix-turn-helix domain-containing protein [Moheibacter sp.]